jgi:tRNA dimethylallyltransferase
MGPTASGKTDLALDLARQLDAEIISVDSAQVYRGMDIGTAKPDAATLAEVPHHLLDIRDPADAYSAAEFRHDALELIAQIQARNRLPLLAGGTMLYFRALEFGLDELPKADPGIRAALIQELASHGLASLYQRLQQLDPVTAARLHANDSQRILRALEVQAQSGQPLSQWQQARQSQFPWPLVKLALAPYSRAELRERIAQRFDFMLEQGFEDEVRRLWARGDLDADLPSMRAVGYRQMLAHIRGEIDLVAMREEAITATRQLAKRQMTWLRSWPELHWLGAGDLLGQALERIGQTGKQGAGCSG